MKPSQRLSAFLRPDSDRLIHSLKTAVALLISMIVTRVGDFPAQGQWVLITVLVVMCAQSRVGAIMQKSYMRFWGTLLGASIAALTLTLAYPSLLWVTLTLCFATALFSYIADSPSYLSEAGPLGAVTVVIILIGQKPSYGTVLSRFLEINLGILIALFVSRFLWPLHSHTQLRQLVRTTIGDLQQLFTQLTSLSSVNAEDACVVQEDKIASHFIKQTRLYHEVVHESFGRSPITRVFKAILRSERELLHYVSLMRRILASVPKALYLRFNQHSTVQQFYEVAQQLFIAILNQLNTPTSIVGEPSLPIDGKGLENKVYQELKLMAGTEADQVAIDLLIFASQKLAVQLNKTAYLIHKI